MRRKELMQSFVARGNQLISDGNTVQATVIVTKGLQHYSEKILKSITPYAKADAGLLVIALRHIANEVEKNNPGTKEFVAGMSECIIFPDLKEIEKIKKPNRT